MKNTQEILDEQIERIIVLMESEGLSVTDGNYERWKFHLEQILTAQEWISVEDKLPEPNEEVLIYTAGDLSRLEKCIRRGYYSTILEPTWCLQNGYTVDDVEYWMELPTPPKEEDE